MQQTETQLSQTNAVVAATIELSPPKTDGLSVYYISLDRAPGRQVLMQQEFDKNGIEAIRVPAIDLEKTSEAELLQQCRPEGPWGPFHPGNMACTLSHAKVWETFLASDAEHALIFEDDVFIASELKHWIEDLSWWPENCGIVRLEVWRSPSLKVVLGPKNKLHLKRSIAPLLSRHPGSAGYIVTRKAAHELLAAKPYDLSIDQLLFNPLVSRLAVGLNPHQIHPALVQQGNTLPDEASTLGARPARKGRKRKSLKRGWAELRAVPQHLWRLGARSARLTRVEYLDRAMNEEPLKEATKTAAMIP